MHEDICTNTNVQSRKMSVKSKNIIVVTAVENALRPAMYAKGKPIAAMNILDRIKYYNVPGVRVAVIENGKIDWAKGYGIKESGSNDPVTPETLFQAASINKPVTTLGVLYIELFAPEEACRQLE
jgi:CubicO group peptidase (beta-lactamase class C family)